MFILAVGRIGVGKNFVCDLLQKKWFPGAGYIDIGDVVSKIAHAKRNEREKLQNEITKHKDPDWLFKELEKTIYSKRTGGFLHHKGPNDAKTDVMIMSGLREPYLLYRLMDTYKEDFLMLRLDTDDYIRYCRLCSRDEYLSAAQFEEFNERDSRLGLDILMDMDPAEIISFNGLTILDVQANNAVEKLLDHTLHLQGFKKQEE